MRTVRPSTNYTVAANRPLVYGPNGLFVSYLRAPKYPEVGQSAQL
jgi:hypothetical protein